MEKVDSLICTRCGSHHIEVVNDELFKCTSCDALIKKEKALGFEKEYRRLTLEGKNIDIANLRSIVKKALEGHIDKDSLIKYSQDILRILPEDTLSLFYIKYINRKIDPIAYELFLESLINKATITEVDEIINRIISSTQKREEERIRKLANYFYGTKYDDDIDKALLKRQEEIELFSDIPRDIFICHSSLDIDKVNEILKELEEDGNTCWISSRNIPWDSDNYWDNITKAIKSCNIFLCLNSINTMQSNDCRREVEIASSLNKKRIEYKLDDAKDITLFKNFFTGQWITNTNDLLDKVYDLKHKEEKLYREGISLFKNKKYQEAILIFTSIESYEDAKKYLIASKELIRINKLIKNEMYEEAKKLLVLLDSNEDYVTDLIDICDLNRASSNKSNKQIDSKESFNLTKIKMLIDVRKDYLQAEEKIYEALEEDYDNYDLWYYYLKSITKGFKDNSHESVEVVFNNLFRLVTDDKKEELNKLDNKLNPVTIKRLREENKKKTEKARKLEEENRKKEEEEKIKKAEEARKLEEENRKKEEERKRKQEEKLNNCKKGDIIEFGSYPQTIKSDNIIITETKQDERGYYTGSDGEKYELLKANPCDSDYTFSNGETIVKNKEYYFKVEQIKWKVVEDKDGKAFLFSELILDAHRFDDSPNDYSISSIRKWLNNEFYNKAFTDKEKKLISIETIDIEKIIKKRFESKLISESISDKVFLLSKEEITNASYGFNSDNDRCKKVTDYAKANHVYEYKVNKNGWYWLRTPLASYSSGACYDRRSGGVRCNGSVGWGNVDDDSDGVVPALSFCKAKA